MPYYDHVTELRYLRDSHPSKFNLTNELSQKKFIEAELEQQNTLNYQ